MTRTRSEPKTFVATNIEEAATFFGVSPSAINQWVARGCPGSREQYDLGEMVRWLRKKGPWQPWGRGDRFNEPGAFGDPMLDSPAADSPALERFRLARAKLSEIELAERQQSVMPRDSIVEMLNGWSAIIRRSHGLLRDQFGEDAAIILEEAIRECERSTVAAFDESPGSGGVEAVDQSKVADADTVGDE